MNEKKTESSIFHQVKAIMKSLNLDQAQLGDKLGITQASVSRALNGNNEKTFQKIIQLLESDYGVTSLNQHLESAVGNDLLEIKKELQEIKEGITRLKEIKEGIEEVKEMIRRLEK